MARGESAESLLEKAENKEKEYAWSEAAELYGQTLRAIGETTV